MPVEYHLSRESSSLVPPYVPLHHGHGDVGDRVNGQHGSVRGDGGPFAHGLPRYNRSLRT